MWCVLVFNFYFFFCFVSARSLDTLRVPRSKMSDSIVEQVAGRLSSVTFLDLSYCGKIGTRALEAIGKHCKMLSRLCWNLHPLDMVGKPSKNDEAHAIATTMPKLKHLEIAYVCLDTTSVLEIISNCPELEFLDLRGCWEVKLDHKWLMEKFPKLEVLGPHVVDHLDRSGYWECEDSSDFSDYDYESLDAWDDEGRLEGVELAFYNGIGDDWGYGWPPSP